MGVVFGGVGGSSGGPIPSDWTISMVTYQHGGGRSEKIEQEEGERCLAWFAVSLDVD